MFKESSLAPRSLLKSLPTAKSWLAWTPKAPYSNSDIRVNIIQNLESTLKINCKRRSTQNSDKSNNNINVSKFYHTGHLFEYFYSNNSAIKRPQAKKF